MAAKSRDDMVTSAKQLASMENSSAITDAEWAEYVERGVQELWDLLLDTFGSDYFSKTATITLVSGTEDYDLPTDFHQLININWDYSGKRRDIDKFEWNDEARFRNLTLLDNRIYYRIIGADRQDGAKKIKFLPVPSSGDTVYYRYTFRPVFTIGSDEIDAVNGYEEYAELVAAIKALNKESDGQNPPLGLHQDLQRVKERIMSHRASQDRARPAKIVDIRRDQFRRFKGTLIDEIV